MARIEDATPGGILDPLKYRWAEPCISCQCSCRQMSKERYGSFSAFQMRAEFVWYNPTIGSVEPRSGVGRSKRRRPRMPAHPSPHLSLDSTLRETSGYWLEIRCGCGASSFQPCRMLAQRTARLKCRCCRSKPASVVLIELRTSGKRQGTPSLPRDDFSARGAGS